MPLSIIRRRGSALTLLLLLGSACGNNPPARAPSPSPSPIRVEWSKPDLSIDAGGGWTIRRCAGDRPALCVDKDGTPAGRILMEDLPTLGEELTSSADQVQATLAVRTQTVYRLLQERRAEQCGPDYTIKTDIPRPVTIAGAQGLRYGAAGTQGGRTVERTIGYRVFREGIETLLEATAIDPGGCLTPLEPTFSVEQMGGLTGLLDRIAAGSVLPPPTDYPKLPLTPGGSIDPRMAHPIVNGIAISQT